MILKRCSSKISVQMAGNLLLFLVFVALPVTQGLYFHIAETERKCFIEEIPDETMVIGNDMELTYTSTKSWKDIFDDLAIYLIFKLFILGNYRLQLYDPRTNGFAPSSPEIGMHVEIRDPEDKIILSKVYSSEGRWTFTSHTPGEHVICLYTNSSKWFSGTQLVNSLLPTGYILLLHLIIFNNRIANASLSTIISSLFQRVHLDIQVGEHAIDYANVAQKEKLSELQLRVRQLLDQVEQITKEQNYQRVGPNEKYI